MSESDRSSATEVELSSAEQWVVHHVLLDALGLADGERSDPENRDPPPEPAIRALEKLEDGAFEFTLAELAVLRRACSDHARNTNAVADRNLASAVAERIDDLRPDLTV